MVVLGELDAGVAVFELDWGVSGIWEMKELGVRCTFVTMLEIVFVGHVGLESSTTHAVAMLASMPSVIEVHFIVRAETKGDRDAWGLDRIKSGIGR